MKEYKKWQGKSVVEPKLDGIHAKVTKNGVHTKTGKPIKTVPHIAKAMKRHFKKNPDSKVEGELHRRGNSFEKNLGKFRGGDGKKLKLYVHGDEKPSRLTRHVRRVKGKVVKDEVALNKAHEKNLRRSYEGSVVKRGGIARKLKPKYDEELPVVGSKMRKDGRAGVVSVKGRDGKVFKAQGSASESARAKVGNRATVVYQKTKSGSVRGAKLKSVRNRDFEVRNFEADSRLARVGVDGYNKPKRTPGHAKKSHVVVVKEGGKVKVVRFGEQGAKVNQTVAQRKAFKSRHAKNISRGKMSAAYWADKVKWSPSNTVNKKSVEKHEFAGRIKSVNMKRLIKVLAKKNAKKARKVAAKLPIEVRTGAAVGAMIPVPGALPAGAAVGGLALGKEAVERAVRKKTGRPYRLFDSSGKVMNLEPKDVKQLKSGVGGQKTGGRKLNPGVYHGARPVKVMPIFNHEYTVVVPKHAKRLDPKIKRKMRTVNGQRVLVSGAYNRDGKLKPKLGDKSDVDALRGSIKKLKKVSSGGSTQAARDAAKNNKNYKTRKYPGLLKNLLGKGVNSNSYARAQTEKLTKKKMKNGFDRTPGSDLRVELSTKEERAASKRRTRVVRVKRDKLAMVKDGVSIGGSAAVGVGSLMGGKAAIDAAKDFKKTSAAARAAAKNVSKITPASVATEVGKKAKGKVKSAFPMATKIAKALTKKRRFRLFEAHEFVSKRDQFRDRKSNQWADPMKAYTGKQKVYKTGHDGSVINVDGVKWHDAQVAKTAYNKGKKVARNTGRAGRAARDVSDVIRRKPRRKDAAGRNKKREWEKAYAKNAAGAAAGGAAVLGYHTVMKKDPKIRSKRKWLDKGLRKVAGKNYGRRISVVERAAKSGLNRKAASLVRKYLSEELDAAVELAAKFRHDGNGAMKWKSSASTVTPDDFLSRSLPFGKNGPHKPAVEKYRKAIRNGEKVDMPQIWVEKQGKGISNHPRNYRVTGHEGRHRMVAARAEGVKKVPVEVFANSAPRHPQRSKAMRKALKMVKHFRKQKGFSEKLDGALTEFDAARQAGWDVRDPRGRSARVFAPGSRRRNRREKRWHEKTENERKLWKAGLVAAALVGGGVGAKIVRRGNRLPTKGAQALARKKAADKAAETVTKKSSRMRPRQGGGGGYHFPRYPN